MEVALLDTNIVSALFRQRDELSQQCARIVGQYDMAAISFMTLAELMLWPKQNGWGQQRIQSLQNYLVDFPVLFPDHQTCEIYSDVQPVSRRMGRPISDSDAWIAATVMEFRIPLITRNHRDFEFLDDLELIPIGEPASGG